QQKQREHSRRGEKPQRTDAHGLNRFDFLIDLHCAQFRRKRGADACSDHNPRDQRTKFTGKSNGHQTWNQPLRSEALQLVARQSRHCQPEKEARHPHQRHRIHSSPYALAEKAGCAEGGAPLLHAFHAFLERVYHEPENAADLAQKSALDLNDLERMRLRATCFAVRHGGDFASLRPREKRKLAGAEIAPSRNASFLVHWVKPLRHSMSYSVTFALMRLTRACLANCFFAFMLFNAAASETRP